MRAEFAPKAAAMAAHKVGALKAARLSSLLPFPPPGVQQSDTHTHTRARARARHLLFCYFSVKFQASKVGLVSTQLRVFACERKHISVLVPKHACYVYCLGHVSNWILHKQPIQGRDKPGILTTTFARGQTVM